ncbi:glycosyltransferase family 2 protein [Humibacillus xanthopallidus]
MTRDRWPDLQRSLPRHEGPVVLVDNASSDHTVERVGECFPDVTVVALPHNAGAPARNAGVRRATTPYVAFADDDSWWESGALERAAELLDAHPRVALLAARVLVGDDGALDGVCEQMARSPLGTRAGEPGPRVLGFIACGAVVRRTAFLEAGGFDDVVFFPGEEERLALDLAARGWGLCYAPELVARHVPSVVREGNAARRAIIARNALLTAVMRRPVTSVLATVCRLASDRCGRRGVVAALPRLRIALRERSVLPPAVEAQRRALDD